MDGKLIFYDNELTKIKEYVLIKLPIKEAIINKKSEEIYAEAEPCIIYSTAIINRIGLELYNHIDQNKLNETLFDIEEINKITKSYIKIPDNAQYGKFI